MSRSTFLVTALALVLAGTFVFAQQAGQSTGQQPGQSQYQGGAGGSAGGATAQPGGAMTMRERTAMGAQRIATMADQQNIDLYKAVQTAEQQAKGKAIAAVLLMPQGAAAGAAGAGTAGTAGQPTTLNAHVVVATPTQLQFVAVDAKSDKVLAMQNRPFIRNLWAPAGAGGTSEMGGTSGGTAGSAGGSAAQQPGELTQPVAQKIYQQAEQENTELSKIIQTAESQTKGKAVAAFFLPPGRQGAMGATGGAGTSAGGETGQQMLTAHVFTVENSQIRLAVVDAKNDKVLNVETRSMISAPWEGRMGAMGGGAGGSTGGGAGETPGQPGSVQQPSGTTPGGGNPSFPTGSGEGTGPGTLGGQ